MNRIPLIDRHTATEPCKARLDPIHAAFGSTPNMFRAVANSPAALKSMWGSFGALGSGILGARLGEQIAVAVADRNACEYCLSADTALGRKAGASSEEMSAAPGRRVLRPEDRRRFALCHRTRQRAQPGGRCRRAGAALGRFWR